MVVLNRGRRHLVSAILVVIAAHSWAVGQSLAQTQSVSIIIVRHAESDASRPTVPLTTVGRQRAELLVHTLRGVKFTHIFATHTTRTRQTLEAVAAQQVLPIVQLPVPGSILDGQPVTDQTPRRAPVEPIATALAQLPPGSVALAALNSENIYAILSRLGVPVAPRGQSCPPAACVCRAPTIHASLGTNSTVSGISSAILVVLNRSLWLSFATEPAGEAPIAERVPDDLRLMTLPNNTFDRTAGSHSLAAAGQRGRYAKE